MNFKLTAAAVVALCMSFPASAQVQDPQSLRDASVLLYQVCIVATGDMATNAGCACTAGFIGGALTEREYEIAARLGEIAMLDQSGASDEEIQAEVDAFFADGYTQAEAEYVNTKLSAAAARGDAICSPYTDEASS